MRTRSLIFLVLLPSAILTGCVSLPAPDEMKAEVASYQLPMLPEPGKAICYVVRPADTGWLVRFNVFVDSQKDSSEMGYTRSNQYIYFNLPPGNHTIYSKAENWAEIGIYAKPGDIIFIEQETEMGAFMARNNLIRLKDYEGKYHVKTLTVGTILQSNK